MSNIRENILLSTLYLADEDILSKDLILYLDKNVSREEAVTPGQLASKCFMYWAESPKAEPSNEKISRVLENLNGALAFAWSHNRKYLARVAKLQRSRMRGWRISEAHRLRRIEKQCEAAGIELVK